MDMTKPAAGFSDVGYEEAMRRARELISFLREQAPKCEEARKLTPAVMDALNRTGMLRYLQPRVRGGMELPFIAYFDIPEMLSRGDMSVGWVVANLASHHRNLVWWDPKAQEEVWSRNLDAGIASGIAFQQGRGRLADGGIVLSGEWNFSSGTDHSDWSMLACIVRDGDKPVDYVYCLLHCADYEVVDDWHTLGMRATSSKTVRCKDVFVPAYRVLSMYVAREGHSWPGLEVHRNPHYRIPTTALGGHCIGGCMVGNARAALEISIDHVKSRSTSYSGAKMREFPTVQLRISAAAAKIDAAALLLRNDCVEAQGVYEGGGTLDVETRLRYKRNCALAAKLCVEAVDSLHEMAGANGIFDKYPLQRIFRDARAAAGHFSFSTDAQLPPWGLVALGGEFKSPTL
ncbi:MAG: acyl-CoA dehydrogenase family protein [Betaproteobacteria bacterium]|nr:acyl-CoA dehydrogenase family protein [Betaproteobacteria bacterium]MDH3437069.1 acyl-CoA dehydrogenase family protein [Betaproteobacteria bacterium]